jgi:hypothetical protein
VTNTQDVPDRVKPITIAASVTDGVVLVELSAVFWTWLGLAAA